jgi:hypothetical protein
MAATIKWVPRWWHWLLFVLVFLLVMTFTVLLALRTSGRNDYQRVIADLRAKGKAATIDEFIARAPAVDVDLQERWHRWSQSGIEYPSSALVAKLKSDYWIRYVYNDAPLPPEILQGLEDARIPMQIARDLLRDPRLLVSGYGLLAHDLPPGKRTLPHAAEVRIPNLLTTRSLANWLHDAACSETDPRQALDDLDRFHRALSRPACLIDAMIWVAISSIRNETYLHLALLGRLPDSNRDAWVAEQCDAVAGVADGFDGERALFIDSWTQMAENTSLLGSFNFMRMQFTSGMTPSPSWRDVLNPQWLYSGPWMWATTHHDSAISAELETHISARLRGERTDPIPDWSLIKPRYWGLGAIAMPNLMESGITALESDARHRMHQLAVRLLANVATAGLPTDVAELSTRLGLSAELSPSGDRLHLTYERLSAERFRLVVSPTSPVPNFDAPGRLAFRTKPYGTPPDKRPLVTHPYLEVLLPARLRRTP